MCTTKSIDDLFEGKPEGLMLAFDQVLIGVIDWEPCSLGPSTNTVIFTKEKAWLIVRPMTKELDLKFYYPEVISHPLIKKTSEYRGKHAHHIRIKDETQVNEELIGLLRKGWEAY